MKKTLTVFFLPFFLIPHLYGDPTVTLKAPQLDGEGMENLQVMLDSSIEGFVADITALVSTGLDKPLFMEGFVNAATRSSLVPGTVFPTGKTGIVLGSTVAIYSESLSLQLINRISTLNEDSDEKTGASTQPLSVSAELSLNQVLQGFRVGATAGYLEASASGYGLTAWTAGVSSGVHILSQPQKLCRWNGIDFSIGGSFAHNKLSAEIKPGRITQEVIIDVDDDGRLVGFPTTLSLNPEILGGVNTDVWTLNARLATALTFLDSLSLFAGAGWTVGHGTAGISLETDEAIEVEGYLGGLIKEDGKGRITITGNASSRSFIVQSVFLQTGLRFSVGLFHVTLPVIWTPNNGLATGMFAGVTF